GADTKRIRTFQHDRIKTYGAGRDRDKRHWRFIIDELLAQDAIRQDVYPYQVLIITQKGSAVLYGKEQITALKKEEPKGKSPEKGSISSQYDAVLFEKLRHLRKKIAEEGQVPPFIIFSDKTLHEMCRYYPADLSEMRKISGVGDAKIKRYGDAFVCEIKGYLMENPSISVTSRQSAGLDRPDVSLPREKNRGETVEETYNLFKKGLSLEEIAKHRNLSISTIAGHIEKLLQEGRDIDIDALIEPAKRRKIEELFVTSRQWGLRPVVDIGNGTVTYEEARLVRVCMSRKDG
ncbi:MAG TPA: helix-turn-helix domain-containing protein, partial [Candidatus Brocadiales bacterium]|nr:helix-turn-helix domain-containing protein [Candidatus Brocadiales bacterium]